jgi:hypothetical protein
MATVQVHEVYASLVEIGSRLLANLSDVIAEKKVDIPKTASRRQVWALFRSFTGTDDDRAVPGVFQASFRIPVIRIT